MRIVADTHTHTLMSGEAFCTINENVAAAKKAGLSFLAVTDHACAMEGAATQYYFRNLPSLPSRIDGIELLRGVEADVIDYNGGLDLPDEILAKLDWVIASFHGRALPYGTQEDCDCAWMAVAENPLVDVIGHCGNPAYPFTHEPLVRAFADNRKIVEINNHSFAGRPGSAENCKHIAQLCMKYGVPVVVSSDAHYNGDIGRFDDAVSMLESIQFPEELILNADSVRFGEWIRRKGTRG